MATSLGGTALAEPTAGREGYQRTEIDQGAHYELASGALVFDYVTARYRHKLTWSGITAAERTTIKGKFDDAKATALALVPPSGGSYTVLAVPSSWREDYLKDGSGTERWYVSLELEDSS